MRKESEEFFKKMLEYFPSAQEGYLGSIDKYGEVLETVIIEDIFMPKLLSLLDGDACNTVLLEKVFRYFEKILNSKDIYMVDILSITVLEVLGNDKRILEVAKKYMGAKTMQLQREADMRLGRA